MGNIFAYGGQVTLIGLSIVFAALILLICCIYALSWILRTITGAGKTEKKAAPAPKAEPAPVAAPAPVVEEAPVAAEPAAVEEEELVTDPQIIAVIAAAIAACDANTRFVVRSVKRSSGWKKSARNEAVSRF